MTELSPRLAQLGDALEAAARADLPAARNPRRRRLALIGVAAAIVIPGAALAAERLISNDEVAASLPAGTLSLAGTEPTCTTVREAVEFHCVLANAPAPEVADWKGTVEPTVDASKHVNGGCRSLTSEGTEWECYIGEAAVDQQIVGPQFLGEYAPSPGVG
jgi:hypothetical protein